MNHEYFRNPQTVAEITRGARDVAAATEVIRTYTQYLFEHDITLVQLQIIDLVSRKVFDQLEKDGKIDKNLMDEFGDVLFAAPEENEDLFSNDWKVRS